MLLPLPHSSGRASGHRGSLDASSRAARTGVLTVSLEDYFHVGAFGSLIPRGQWYRFESRIEQAAMRTLDLLDECEVRATFFVLGVVAEQFPELVRAVRERGHEVASKGYQHRNIRELSASALADDLARAREVIEDALRERILGCRLSGWLSPRDAWALDVIAEQGYVYDASMRPLGRSHAGMPGLRRPYVHRSSAGLELWEVPVSSVSLLGCDLPLVGGNWMRQLPPPLVRHAVARFDRQAGLSPLVLYFHSWELDDAQPRIDGASLLARLRHYRNLRHMPARLREHLTARRFVSVRQWLGDEAPEPSVAPPRSRRRPQPTPRASALVPPARGLPRVAASVVIPCFDEERTLPYLANTLRRLEESLGGAYDLRFVLVDDGSRDGTLVLMRMLFADWANVTVLRHTRNRGVAAAIRTGVLATTTDIVCTMDCDCTYDPHELARMIPRLRADVDVVVASPYHAGGSARHLPRWRRALARSAAALYRRVLRQPLSCYTSSFRVYRRDQLLDMPVRRDGFIGVTEMLARLDLAGATIVEHPVTLDARVFGRARLAVVRGILGHLGLLAELAWLRARGRAAPRRIGPPVGATVDPFRASTHPPSQIPDVP